MIWLALGIAVTALAMVATASALVVKYVVQSRDDRVVAAKLGTRLELTTIERDDVAKRYGQAMNAADDARKRLEAVIVQKDARITEVERQLDELLKDIDPGLLGSSLRDISILQPRDPAAGTVAAGRSEVAAGLRTGPAPILGANPGRPPGGG